MDGFAVRAGRRGSKERAGCKSPSRKVHSYFGSESPPPLLQAGERSGWVGADCV